MVDANIVLRYMLDDHAELSLKARQIIDGNMIEVPIEVLCEVVFVLSKVYGVERGKIGFELSRFIENADCELHRHEGVVRGLEFYSQSNLDFVDCLLAGYSCAYGSKIATFDEKLLKFMGTTQGRKQ